MSRLPRSVWLGSSTSPPAMTRSNLRAESAALKARAAGRADAWATRVGVSPLVPAGFAVSVAPAAAAGVEGGEFRRGTSMPGLLAPGGADRRAPARELSAR